MEIANKNLIPSLAQMNETIPSEKVVKNSTIASLFAGCGGLDLGFVGGFKYCGKTYKRLPHDIVWANEIDKYACAVYRQNMKHDILEDDINEVLKRGDLPSNIDILLGGFPCQDFSQAGKRQGFNNLKRGTLYKAMAEVARLLKPQVFIAENVRGILSIDGALEKIKQDFSDAGFCGVQEYLVQAADYGVPQNRERVLIIGWKYKKHAAAFTMPKIEPRRNVRTAISDLANTAWDKFDGHTWALAKRRTGSQGNEVTKGDGLAYTVRAEHHMNIQYHYDNERRLSVREAARLQTFPDKFKLGDVSKHQGYKMIGNAVPPVLAWHVAKSINEALSI